MYSRLGCGFLVFIYFQAPLAFRVSIEKVVINTMSLPLYISWYFSLAALIIFLCCGFSVLIVSVVWDFFFGPIYVVSCSSSCTSIVTSCWKYFVCLWEGFFPHLYLHYLYSWSFHNQIFKMLCAQICFWFNSFFDQDIYFF